MQGKTWYYKLSLILELKISTRKRRLSWINKVVEEFDVRLEIGFNIEPGISPLLDTLKVEAQLKIETTPSKLSGETSLETFSFREEIPIDIDRGVWEDTLVIMD